MTFPPDADLGAVIDHLRRFVGSRLDEIEPGRPSADAPQVAWEMYGLIERGAAVGQAQLALDLLATELSDRFGSMVLSPPTAYMADVMLHARAAGPADQRFGERLASVLDATLREVLGPDAMLSVAVVPVRERGDVVAVVQALFPPDLDLDAFTRAFSTSDYFTWQVELGRTPGVGEVTSEPCTVLGADVPGDDLPPNLMISFAVLGDLQPTVRAVVQDLRQRLARATEPTVITVGVSVALTNTTPETVRREITRWSESGYVLLDHDEDALAGPMRETTLLFEFPPVSLSPAVEPSSLDEEIDAVALTRGFSALLETPDEPPRARTDPVGRAAALLAAAERVTVLTGAGISTESGIPDYRGPNGVWTTDPASMRLVDIDAYLSDPQVRRDAWQERLHHAAWEATPSSGHRALVELERSGKLRALITQNIDGLHQTAGSGPDAVLELHGTIFLARCLTCGHETPMQDQLDRVRAGELDPPCEVCGGIQRSATVAFGQSLDPTVLRRAVEASGECDLFLAIGTSLLVQPAASLCGIAIRSGARCVIVNGEPTPFDDRADVVVRGVIGEVLPQIVGAVPR